MEKRRPLARWAGIMLVCAAASLFCIESRGETESAAAPPATRPDLIKIDTLAAYQKLELPAVTFFHDKHTDALLKEKKGCDTCHFVEDNLLSLAFRRKKRTNPAEIKEIYHTGCIGCHMDMAAAGKVTGPPDGLCRSCHDDKPQVAAFRLDAGLDKVLHFRHVDAKSITSTTADKDNCSRCHHEYDQKTKKTFYAKGQESTCRYCHGEKEKAGVKSLEQASHLQCVLCHQDLASKVKENVPVRCEDCHAAAAQAQVAKRNRETVAKLKNQEVPRLNRGQPDAALITPDPKFEEVKAVKTQAMNPVAFDHQAHEKFSDSCRVCHHASLEPCQKCHTLGGSPAGKSVTFEQAMHLKSSILSCIGCHNAKQAAANCAGCHQHIEARRPDDAACLQCHLPPPVEWRKDVVLTAKQKAGLADTILKARKPTTATYPESDIPETVVIKELADKYQPVEMSHRKHVLALLKGTEDSLLARYFHRDPGTLCQGCHHHSPPSKTPPGCSNCHARTQGQALSPDEPARPGLLAAQHGQCMSCHKIMAVKPEATACTECHQEKKK